MPAEIIMILSMFASTMTVPTWKKAETLIIGALLCRGPRRITSILRVLGKSEEPRFERYHRVLNRDRWSCVHCAKILLGLLIALLPSSFPILILIDETLERRKGKKIGSKGYYRDAVRSTEKNVVKCLGLKWICMTLLVPLPWNKRPWALPFLTILAPSKKSNEERGRRHKTIVEWTLVMINLLTRWLRKPWVLIGDGAYACIHLGHYCNQKGVTLVSRLRLDAALYARPEPVPHGRRGRKPIKGKRESSLKELAKDRNQARRTASLNWYSCESKKVRYLTGVSLWYKAGEKPLPIRWVLVIDENKPDRPEAFFSTDINICATKIIEWFVLRWNIEVTFEEVRAHIGVETQRQWSDKAIGRTTPVLMGLYSLACLIGKELSQSVSWKPAASAWYQKGDQCTFFDVMALIKRCIWSEKYFPDSGSKPDSIKLTLSERNSLIDLLAAVT